LTGRLGERFHKLRQGVQRQEQRIEELATGGRGPVAPQGQGLLEPPGELRDAGIPEHPPGSFEGVRLEEDVLL
jgi:hypothetical protein